MIKMKNSEITKFKKWIKYALAIASTLIILQASYIAYMRDIFSLDFCLEKSCVERFVGFFDDIPSSINSLVQFLSYVFTIAGVFYALKTYISNLDAIKTNIHLSHLNSFKDYLALEISTFDGVVSIKNFNIYKWYNVAYPNSCAGSLEVSDNYGDVINELNLLIEESNRISSEARRGEKFDYTKHQGDVIKALKKIGINLPRKPRNDFYEMEGNVFDFIQKVNLEFLRIDDGGVIKARKYN